MKVSLILILNIFYTLVVSQKDGDDRYADLINQYNLTVQKNIGNGNSSDFLKKMKNTMNLLPINEILRTENELCEEHSHLLIDGVMDSEKWALRMFDSSAKFVDGFIEGRFINVGNPQECIEETEPYRSFKGKSCIARIHLTSDINFYDVMAGTSFGSSRTQYLKNENFTAPFVFLHLCIPSTCTADDINISANRLLRQKNHPLVIDVIEEHCVTDEKKDFDAVDWAAVAVLVIFALIVILSTIYDVHFGQSGSRKEILTTFSLSKNFQSLLQISETDLQCLHGIRFITAFWVMAAHSYLLFLLVQASNTMYLMEDMLSWGKIAITNSFLSADTFFLLSGFLMSYLFFNKMENKNLCDFNILKYYLYRYLRITPTLAVVILFSASLVRHAGSGPFWETAIHFYTDNCRAHWWVPLVHVQNYLNLPMCLDYTWFIAVLCQLYLLSPIALILIWKLPKAGMVILILLIIAGIGTVFGISYNEKEHFILVEAFQKAANEEKPFQLNFSAALNTETYMKTHTRFPAWLIGILLGFVLHKYNEKIWKVSKLFIAVGWICSIILVVGSICLAHPIMQKHYNYSALEVALYLAIHRVTWCLGISWIIFACVSGYGGIVNMFLSLKFWTPLSRLSYCFYLIHPVIIYMRTGDIRGALTIYDTTSFFEIISTFGMALIAALFLNLMFEAPIMALLSSGKKESHYVSNLEAASLDENQLGKRNHESMNVD